MYDFNAVTRAYFNETIRFARSIVFKSSHSIVLENLYLQNLGYVEPEDPREYKYYLNLNGQYHESDEMVYVISSDTQERIPFTKESLRDHPITSLDYRRGGEFHLDFLRENKQHSGWLDRVLDPIDMDVAINAEDFEILSYGKEFVASNEVSLMNEIQQWLYRWRSRWYLPSHSVKEDLVPPASFAVLANSLVLGILGIRQTNIRTDEVDQFHLWMYLGSRYRLDRYKDYLTVEQSLWLYRNIEYLRFNVGKEKVMEDLLEHIGRPSSIYGDRFDLATTQENLLSAGSPTPIVLINPYSVERPEYEVDNRDTVSYATSLTTDVARFNEEDFNKDVAQLERDIVTTSMRTLPTGQVRLRVREELADVMLNPLYSRVAQWLVLASENKFIRTHEFQLNDKGVINVTTREAAMLFNYAGQKILGTTPTELLTYHIPRHHPHQGLSEGVIETFLHKDLIRDGLAAKMAADWVPHPTVRSSLEFEDYIEKVKYRYLEHRLDKSSYHGAPERGDIKSVFINLYPPAEIQFPLGPISLNGWLDGLKFPYNTMETIDYLDMMTDMISKIAGIDIEGQGISSKHKALMEIIKLFAPYSMVFTDGNELSTPIVFDNANHTPYNVKTKHYGEVYVLQGVQGTQTSSRQYHDTYASIEDKIHQFSRKKITNTVKIGMQQYSMKTAVHNNTQTISGVRMGKSTTTILP